jgi:hypothetical protein
MGLLDSALGWMQDPNRTQQLQGLGKSIQQGLLNIEQSDKRYQDLYDKAFGDPKSPFKVTDKKALSQLTEMTQNGLLGMAEVGMFVGAGSKAFDKAMAFTASKLEKKGLSPQEIWKETGTVRGPDGQWRQEISDKEAFIKGNKPFEDVIMGAYDRGVLETGDQLYKTTVGDVMYHNPLKEAYPKLMGIETQMMRKGSNARGSLGTDKASNEQILAVKKDLPPEEARSTMLHELQHAVQEKEGFGVGGNVDTMARLRSTIYDKIGDLNSQMGSYVKAMDASTDPLEKAALKQRYDAAIEERMKLVPFAQLEPMDAYRSLIGEAEARLTQTRRDLNSAQRKQFFPFEFQDKNLNPYGLDVPPNMLIHLDENGNLVQKGLLGQ